MITSYNYGLRIINICCDLRCNIIQNGLTAVDMATVDRDKRDIAEILSTAAEQQQATPTTSHPPHSTSPSVPSHSSPSTSPPSPLHSQPPPFTSPPSPLPSPETASTSGETTVTTPPPSSSTTQTANQTSGSGRRSLAVTLSSLLSV